MEIWYDLSYIYFGSYVLKNSSTYIDL